MTLYDFIFILTIPIDLLTIYRLYYCFFDEILYGKKTEIISYILYEILCTIFLYTINIPMIMLIINIFLFYLISLNYKGTMLKRIAYSLLFYAFLGNMEIAVVFLTGYINVDFWSKSNYSNCVGIILVRILGYTIITLIYKHKKTKSKSYQIPIYYYISHIIILIGTIYLYLSFIKTSALSKFEILFSSLTFIIINFLILFVDDKIYENTFIKFENDVLKEQNIAYLNQTEIVNQSIETIKLIRHDIKNHILVLKSLYKHGDLEEIKKYTDKMLNEIENNNTIVKSGNFIIDSIVNSKLKKLDSNKTEININIDVSENINILAYDLAIILGNLLDNAISAVNDCKCIAEFNLCIVCDKNCLVILINNSYQNAIIVEDDIIKTTKKDKTYHGLGIKSVKNTVEKYGGELKINYNKDTFSSEILIPYK